MLVYIANTRTRDLIKLFQALGWGQMYCRGRLSLGGPPTRWAYDNGAFIDWQHRQPFNAHQFIRDVRRIRMRFPDNRPDFGILPDLVARGNDSLEESLSWLPLVGDVAPWYLAVQDGMTPASLPWGAGFRGVFVGGSLDWKHATARDWVSAAHDNGLPCHIGRVGTPAKVEWAKSIGADSIDSSFPLWTRDRMCEFVQAVADTEAQTRLF